MRLTAEQRQEIKSYYKGKQSYSSQFANLDSVMRTGMTPEQNKQYTEQQTVAQTQQATSQENKGILDKLQDYSGMVGGFLTQIVPGRELGTGLGYALAEPYVKEKATKSKAQDEKLFNTLLAKYKVAREKGDKQRMERLKKVMGDYKTVNVMKEVYDDAPTKRQVVFSAAELAAMAGLAYKPTIPGAGNFNYKSFKLASSATRKGYKTIQSLQKTQKLSKLGTAGKVVEKFVKPVAKQSAIGAGMFGITKARERDATIDDIIKAAETGALISGGLTAGSIAIGEGLGYASKKLGPKISAKWQKTVIGLEKTATGEQEGYKLTKNVKPLPAGTSQIDETLKYVGGKSTFKQKAAKTALRTIQETEKWKMRLVDRFSPLQSVEKRIELAKGKPLNETEKVFRDARLLTSVSDYTAENRVTDMMDEITKYDDDTITKAKAWMVQNDFVDRAKLGQTVPGGQSLDDTVVGVQRLSQEIGPDDMKKVSEIKSIVNNYNMQLLDERVNAGLITPELRDKLIATHPNYIPHNVITDIDEVAVKGLQSSLDVPKTDIYKAVGSVKNIKDPIQATIANTQVATRVIEKNKLMNNLVSVQEKYNLYPGMKKLAQGVDLADDFGKISLFRNGVKETWQVPQDIAIAVKNLDTPVSPAWFKWATTPQKVLKKGATQYNISFSLPNKFRDTQTAALTSQAFIDDMAKKTGVSPKSVNMTEKEILKLYKTSGGYGSSIFSEGETKMLKDLEKTGISKNIKYTNPFQIIETVNNSLERSTRIDVFKRGLSAGLSAKDAAFVAREATIDFAKMGTWMRPANQAIPFLNARVQGFINLPKAFIANPEVFTRMQMYTAVYPTMLLHQHNRRFDSYANISQYIKNKYWVIMVGETDGVDNYSGNAIKVPQFITVPKGEGQTLVASPIQYYLEKSDGIDYRTTGEMLADTLGSASPLEFQTWGGGNIWLTLAGQMGPLVSIPAGLAANKAPYSGSAIVPENRIDAEPYMQYSSYTPDILKELGKAINVSPSKIEFVLGSFGGVPQDTINAIDITYNVVRNGKLGGNSISNTPWGSLTQVPLVRRFMRESGEKSSLEDYQQKQKQEIVSKVDTEKLKINDLAENIWKNLNKKDTEEEKLSYLASLGDQLTPEVKERIYELNSKRGKEFEVLKPTDSSEVRARYIIQRLNEMEEQNAPQSEISEFMRDLKNSGLLTDSVKEAIYQLRQSESL